MMQAVFAFVVVLLSLANGAHAQTASCTTLTIGQTQDITAFSVCRRVTLNSVPAPATGVDSICVPTNITAAEWQSFYDNPPAGVTIGSCNTGCTGYMYNGYCYHWAGDTVAASCDTVCASYGGCNAAGTRFIGSDEPGSTRCSAVATHFAGVSVTATAVSSGFTGCLMNTFKGGYVANNVHQASTTCADTTSSGRFCACNNGSSCALPWGGTIAHGASVTAYQVTTHANCASVSQTRTCSNGVLSGSYTNQACSAPATCGGYTYGGGCYYLGTLGQSCDTYCAGLGSGNTCQLAMTRAVGSGGTNATCQVVLDALGAGGSGLPTTLGVQAGGCVVSNTNTRIRYSVTTTCNWSSGSMRRICACGVSGACDGSGGCAVGTYQFVSNGYQNCGSMYGPYTQYNCIGEAGGSTASCTDTRQMDSCCGGVPC